MIRFAPALLALSLAASARAAVVVHLAFDSEEELAPAAGSNRARGSQGAALVDALYGKGLALNEESHARIDKLSSSNWRGLTVHFFVKPQSCEGSTAILRSPVFAVLSEGGGFVARSRGATVRGGKCGGDEGFTHLALVVKKREVSLFVDGKLVASERAQGGRDDFSGPLAIGAEPIAELPKEPDAKPFEGVIDELQIADDALSAEAIAELSRTPDQRKELEECISSKASAHDERCEETCGEKQHAAHCVFGRRKCAVLAESDKEKELCGILRRECLHNAGTSGEALDACVPQCSRREAAKDCKPEPK